MKKAHGGEIENKPVKAQPPGLHQTPRNKTRGGGGEAKYLPKAQVSNSSRCLRWHYFPSAIAKSRIFTSSAPVCLGNEASAVDTDKAIIHQQCTQQ